MMRFECAECRKEIIVQSVVGHIPPQVPMNNYCSESCLETAHEKNKPK